LLVWSKLLFPSRNERPLLLALLDLYRINPPLIPERAISVSLHLMPNENASTLPMCSKQAGKQLFK
jgi:hypothetical protein